MKIKLLDKEFRCQNFVKNEKSRFSFDNGFDKIDIVENQRVTFSLSKPDFRRFHLLTTITRYKSAMSIPLSICQRKTNLRLERR